MGVWAIVVAALVATAPGLQEGPAGDRLYGRVTTAAGRVYEGYLRWDRNEASWADVLDGSKEIPWEHLEEADRLGGGGSRRWREHRIEFLGFRLSWTEGGESGPSTATSGVRFGHLSSLLVLDEERALLTLKSGEEIELAGGGTDLGEGLRALVVEDVESGEVELAWRDLDRVEFMSAPEGAPAPRARRLYGTLRTSDGQEFTGYVSWDVDEVLTSDILDGEERGRDREIPFAEIAAIERTTSGRALVILTDGEEITLSGSNDVDDSNRGICVADPELGEVTVTWGGFESLTFQEPPAGVGYDAFDGGLPLWGVVETDAGERLEGELRWDNDEVGTWELLNGTSGDVELAVELGRVQRVRRLSARGAEVTLLDGRRFEMEGSNDVDSENKGIFVTPARGSTVLVRWSEVREVVLAGG
jgi:hypothetical protein